MLNQTANANTCTVTYRPDGSIDWTPFIESLDWSLIRRAGRVEDFKLMADTVAWLQALPVGVRPAKLQHRFPRIANDLCKFWHDDDKMEPYIQGLLVDTRHDRQGFPEIIFEELQAISSYWHAWIRQEEEAMTQFGGL